MNVHTPEEESVFLAAIEKRSPQERQAYLDGACAGRPELLMRVAELLKVHDESRGPFDAPAGGFAPTVTEPGAVSSGAVIGPYKLLQQIGEGGMGTVYMAEQTEPVQRKVALK